MDSQPLEPIVFGFHGTTSEAANVILKEGFHLSQNPYDWLGDGVYFFQDAPQRAWEWATEHYGNNAMVVGAEIHLINCMDLLDTSWTRVLVEIYDSYMKYLREAGLVRPRQTGGARRLDREVINYTVGVLAERGTKIACVRGAFIEGGPVFPDSAIYDRAHVQIAVRDIEECIRRVWLERGPDSRG